MNTNKICQCFLLIGSVTINSYAMDSKYGIDPLLTSVFDLNITNTPAVTASNNGAVLDVKSVIEVETFEFPNKEALEQRLSEAKRNGAINALFLGARPSDSKDFSIYRSSNTSMGRFMSNVFNNTYGLPRYESSIEIKDDDGNVIPSCYFYLDLTITQNNGKNGTRLREEKSMSSAKKNEVFQQKKWDDRFILADFNDSFHRTEIVKLFKDSFSFIIPDIRVSFYMKSTRELLHDFTELLTVGGSIFLDNNFGVPYDSLEGGIYPDSRKNIDVTFKSEGPIPDSYERSGYPLAFSLQTCSLSEDEQSYVDKIYNPLHPILAMIVGFNRSDCSYDLHGYPMHEHDELETYKYECIKTYRNHLYVNYINEWLKNNLNNYERECTITYKYDYFPHRVSKKTGSQDSEHSTFEGGAPPVHFLQITRVK